MTWQERINKMFATAGDIKTALINNFTTRINNGTLKEPDLIDTLDAEVKKTLPVVMQPLVEVTQAQVIANPELALSPNVSILSSTSNLTKTVNGVLLDYNTVTGAYEQRYQPDIAATIVAAQALQGVVTTINQFSYGDIGSGGGGGTTPTDITAPQANGIMSTDVNSDSTGTYAAGDIISINFNEPVVTVLLTINDVSLNNSHTLGTGATLVANTPSNGYATRFDITLGTSPSVAASDILSVGIGKARDAANNANVVPISYVIPTIGSSTGGGTAPAASNMFSIVISDTNSDSTGSYGVGDLIAIRFTEPISTTLLTIGDITLNNSHTLGSNATMVPNNAIGGYASEFVITLGSTPTIATGDTLSIAINKAKGMNNNYNTVPINFTVPVIGSSSVTPITYYAETDTILLADTVPSGWLLADGSAVSRTVYAELFAAIGTTYGAGDGSTTFNLPNIPNTATEKSIIRATTSNSNVTTPVGNTIIIPDNGIVPEGYIELDGSWISIDAYPELYTLYGSTYGIDTTNRLFKLPNITTPTAIRYVSPTAIKPTNVSIRAYLTSDTIPNGFILANGATVSRVTYSSIFTAVGTTYGAGDGSTTFTLPTLPDSGSYKMYIGVDTTQETGDTFFLSGTPTVPSGYLRAAGQEVSKVTYSDLYASIGDKYGTAVDTTKFKLPNLGLAEVTGDISYVLSETTPIGMFNFSIFTDIDGNYLVAGSYNNSSIYRLRTSGDVVSVSTKSLNPFTPILSASKIAVFKTGTNNYDLLFAGGYETGTTPGSILIITDEIGNKLYTGVIPVTRAKHVFKYLGNNKFYLGSGISANYGPERYVYIGTLLSHSYGMSWSQVTSIPDSLAVESDRGCWLNDKVYVSPSANNSEIAAPMKIYVSIINDSITDVLHRVLVISSGENILNHGPGITCYARLVKLTDGTILIFSFYSANSTYYTRISKLNIINMTTAEVTFVKQYASEFDRAGIDANTMQIFDIVPLDNNRVLILNGTPSTSGNSIIFQYVTDGLSPYVIKV